MKALFIHDFKAMKYKGQFYSTNMSYGIWAKRYLPAFGSLEICCRTIPTDEDVSARMVVSSGPGVTFNESFHFLYGPEARFIPSIRKALAAAIESADAVIIRMGSALGRIAFGICRKTGKPFLTEVVSCPWDALWNHGFCGKVLAPTAFLGQRKIVRHSTDVIYVTSSFLQRRYPTNGVSVACSNVELQEQDDDVLQRRLDRIRKRNAHDKLIVGTIGGLHLKYKGQQYVIDALRLLREKGQCNFTYQLVGAGDDSRLRRQIEKNHLQDCVEIIGKLEHGKIFDWLDGLDVYIQPSRTEGLPRALVEAMSRGLFCLGARSGGIPELVPSDRLFANGVHEARHIAHLLSDIDTEGLLNDAKANCQKAREFFPSAIEPRRLAFLNRFARKVLAAKGNP